MFKIGDFSKLTHVTVRMLRYYDEMGILKPAKTDPRTGYRLYSASQIPVLNKIIYLRDSGFQVAEIAAAVSCEDTAAALDQLAQKYEEILGNIQREQEKLRKITLARRELTENKGELHYNVTIKAIPSYQVLSYRKIIPTYYGEGDMWRELSDFAVQQNVPVSEGAASFTLYHDSEYKEENVDVELCVPVAAMGEASGAFTYKKTDPVPLMASTMVYGDFSRIADGYLAFAGWLQENSGYRMLRPDRQIVHRGPWNEEEPEEYLTEIQIPIEPL